MARSRRTLLTDATGAFFPGCLKCQAVVIVYVSVAWKSCASFHVRTDSLRALMILGTMRRSPLRGRGYFLPVVTAGFGLGIPPLFITSIITIFDAEMI